MPKDEYTVEEMLANAKRGHAVIKEWGVALQPDDRHLRDLCALVEAVACAPNKLRPQLVTKALLAAYALGKSNP